MATATESTQPRSFSLAGPIGLRQLSRMCHNVGTGLHAGIDIRRVLETEAQRGSPRNRTKVSEIRDRVSRGGSLAEAMAESNGYFPPLVCAMVEIGEKTGRLEQTLLRLAEHYDNMLRLRRVFLMGIAWPLFQLTLGILVVGGYIWISGVVAGGRPPMTIFGLYGPEGAMIFFGTIGGILLLLVLLLVAARNRWISVAPLLFLLMHAPGVSNGLRILAMSRLTWSLAIATESALDPRRAIELAVRTTQNAYYTRYIEQMKRTITRGGEMYEAFAATAVYPDDFLDALQTGETAGRLSESMHVVARDYEDRAKNYLRLLAGACGFCVFLLVAGLLIFMIFSFAMQYIGILNDALEM